MRKIVTLMVILVVCNVYGLQLVPKQNFLYGYPFDSSFIVKVDKSNSGLNNIVYNTTDMVRKDHDTLYRYKTQASDPRDSAVITLKREGKGNALLPIYSLTVYGNGSVIYKGTKNVATSGMVNYHIPKASVRELSNEFIKIYYFALKDKYSDPTAKVANNAIVTTSINMNGEIKTILDDHNSYGPVTLRQLEDKIDQLTNSKQWIYGQDR